MKFDFLYIIGLLLALLAEVFPLMMPVHTPEFAAAIFLVYMATGLRYGKAYVTWMISVFAFFALSMAWAIDVKVGLWGLRQVFVIFIGMMATYNYLKRNPNGLKNILRVYLVESLILVIFILMNIDQFEMGVRLGLQLSEGLEEGQSVNSNVIGMNLCYALFIVFALLVQGKKSTLLRIVALATSVFVIYLTLLTGSRKALIMLMTPLSVFPFLRKKKSFSLLILPIVFGVLVVAANLIMDIPFLYEVLGTRVEDAINVLSGTEQGGEDVSRKFLITYGLEWFQENPIFGYGINNFRVLSNSTSMFMGYNFYAHNNHIELLVDVGIIGFLIYYSFYYYIIRSLKGHFADNRLNKWILVLLVIRLFLDAAMVSYYSFTSNLILCICFYAAEMTQKGLANNKLIKYEAS